MITTNKREVQKKKEQKRKDKQKRKEMRRANASGAFEDMIAYVDANGNITDTPQNPGDAEEINPEDILISIPSRKEEEPQAITGRVEFFNGDKGYGFIKEESRGNRFFFHVSNAPESISEGNMVTFECEQGPRGMQAVRVELMGKDNKDIKS